MIFVCRCKVQWYGAEFPDTLSDIGRHLREKHDIYRLPANLTWQSWKARKR